MKALITGGTGFIGSHVLEKLCSMGFEVKCISKDLLNTNELKSLNTELIYGDLNDKLEWEKILDDVDIVYHIAGTTRAKNYREYYEGNFLATKNFIETCLNHRPDLKRFVYISSLTAVGPSLNGKPVDETTQYHPVSEYGKSKMLAELEVLKYRDKIPVTIIRPSAVYGPREREMYKYMKSVKQGFHMCIGFRKKFLNIIYIDDLAEGIISASLNKQAEGHIYFMGSEISYPNEIIGDIIALIVNKKPLNLHVPHCIIFLICGIQEIFGKIFSKQVFLNIQKARELTQSEWICSVEKAKEELGFSPKVSLYDGFLNTYQWYTKMGWM